VTIFIERRICRLLDRRESDRKRRREAPSLSVDDTQKPDDETTAGRALSGTARLLDRDTSLRTDSDDGQPYATRLITHSTAGARQVPRHAFPVCSI
jgi:hypothetical protein